VLNKKSRKTGDHSQEICSGDQTKDLHTFKLISLDLIETEQREHQSKAFTYHLQRKNKAQKQADMMFPQARHSVSVSFSFIRADCHKAGVMDIVVSLLC